MKNLFLAIITLLVLITPAYAEPKTSFEPALSYSQEDDQHLFELKGIPSDLITGFIINRENVTELVSSEAENENIFLEDSGTGLTVRFNDAIGENNSRPVNGFAVLLHDGTQITVPMEPASSIAALSSTFLPVVIQQSLIRA